ncbi:hypothetical protein [Desulfogranum japonicum]|uniref:hypothetical protein n=1 Tax=Desulfogranum japonicum TaxID=231447 RepID=UPI0004908080|nr:hypothetical protein [Desulfogranum japonicum]
MERILSRANLSEAWKHKANRGAPGVDNMVLDDFMAYAWEHWPEIRSSIFADSYKSSDSTLTPTGQTCRYPKGNRGDSSSGDSCRP